MAESGANAGPARGALAAGRAGSRSLLFCDHRGAGLGRPLAHLAQHGYRIRASKNLAGTLRHLGAGRPDVLVVAPFTRTGSLEFEAIRREGEAAGGWEGPPVLVVADPADPGPVFEAARALWPSNYDVIYRNAPPEEFAGRLERLVLEHERFQETEGWKHRACHDDRTDLLRAKIFETRITEHVSAAQRHGFDLALVLLDLDKFGAINKDYDHTVGDRLIARVGEWIKNGLRNEDSGGRLGGDEFGVLLPYTSPGEAAAVVRRLRAGIATLQVSVAPAGEVGAETLSVTTSIGFETTNGADLDSAETLRNHAEQALRQAKQAGGDRVAYARGALPEAEAKPATERRRTRKKVSKKSPRPKPDA